MKKLIALICVVALVFALTSCSGNNDSDTTEASSSSSEPNNFNNFIGDGEKSTISTLVNAHSILVSDVFVLSHLPVNKRAAIDINGVKYAPVTDESFIMNFTELKDSLYANYTKEAADTILGNPAVYLEKDGIFYYNLDYSSGYFDGEEIYPLKWEGFNLEFDRKENDKIKFFALLTDSVGQKIKFPMEAVIEDGNWKLSEFYVIH